MRILNRKYLKCSQKGHLSPFEFSSSLCQDIFLFIQYRLFYHLHISKNEFRALLKSDQSDQSANVIYDCLDQPSIFKILSLNSIHILNHIWIQVISTSPFDSKTIEDNGGDRIELVSALQIGGITPSSALLRKSLEASHLKTMVMLRHSNESFILRPTQKDLLVQQAVSLIDIGCKGIVLGAITDNKRVDEQFLEKINQKVSTNKIDFTFHKASDYTVDLVETYQTVRKYNIGRVLTQGGKNKVQENVEVLKKLHEIKEVNTLVGGGISFSNVDWLIKTIKPKEIHIGTCVRKDRYGPVQGELIQQFIQKMSKA